MIPCVTELGESWAKLEIACVCGKVLVATIWGDECDIYRCFEGCFRLGKQVDLIDICYNGSVKGEEMVWLPEITF